MLWGGHCIAFAQSKRIQAKKGKFFCNNIVVDPNAPTGQQQPAQGSALGKGHVRRTRWKCNWTARRTQSRVRSSYAEPQPSIALSKSTTRCRCCSQCFCPCRALVCCITLTQGDALGYERVGLSGRSLSERVNCDIIANPLTQSRFLLFSEIAHARDSSNYIRLSTHSIAILCIVKMC